MPDRFWLVVLGDSITWGQGLLEGEKFSTRVERWLSAELARLVEKEVFAHSRAVIAPDEVEDAKPPKPGEVPMLTRLETGRVFTDLRILNFLEGDFFSWYLGQFGEPLESALRRVVDVFRSYEPATSKLSPRRSQDLLKIFYSGVVDEQMRHDLGEFYTPAATTSCREHPPQRLSAVSPAHRQDLAALLCAGCGKRRGPALSPGNGHCLRAGYRACRDVLCVSDRNGKPAAWPDPSGVRNLLVRS